MEQQNVVSQLGRLRGKDFQCIYADPSWPSKGKEGPKGNRPAMSLVPLKSLRIPLDKVLAENAHLHLWTTNTFLLAALDLMRSWEFRYLGNFVWVKAQADTRDAHQMLLIGVRGRLPFKDHTQKSWQLHNELPNGKKPSEIKEVIEAISPGPYLELFGRTASPKSDWHVVRSHVPSTSAA